MPGKKTTKLWVPDEEVSPETLVKVSCLKQLYWCNYVDHSIVLPN